MTTTADRARTPPGVLVGAVAPPVLAGLVCAAVAAVVAGTPGLASGLAGLALVIVFLGFGIGTLLVCRRVAPAALLLVALLTYTLQMMLFALVLVAVARTPALDENVHRTAFALTLVVTTLVLTVTGIRAFTRLRVPAYDLGETR